jgi:hypothetical protein
MRVQLRIAGDLRRHQLRVGGPSRGIMPRHLHRRAAGTVVEADLAITQCEQVWSMKSSTAPRMSSSYILAPAVLNADESHSQ